MFLRDRGKRLLYHLLHGDSLSMRVVGVGQRLGADRGNRRPFMGRVRAALVAGMHAHRTRRRLIRLAARAVAGIRSVKHRDRGRLLAVLLVPLRDLGVMLLQRVRLLVINQQPGDAVR